MNNEVFQTREIVTTSDGSHTLRNQFGSTYHSVHGAVSESAHVFIQAGLHYILTHKNTASVLEIGFGTGLNAFMTYLYAQQTQKNIRYTTCEAYPLLPHEVKELNYAEQLGAPTEQPIFQYLHTANWDCEIPVAPFFKFTKQLLKFENISYQNEFDIIYFDAFEPEAQPELWTHNMLQIMYNALVPQGVLVTYCAKGVVKRTLKAVGFSIETLAGPPGKREMTRATKTEALPTLL
jgi:tRNA U34 5-methylaminomethyl-2-thiouridine-forming methyltransferase MnmC